MDWFSEWQPAPNVEVDAMGTASYSGQLTALVILILVAGIIAAAWYRQRTWRRSFWCATVRRDDEVTFRFGRTVRCSAFGDDTAIACARRCRDRSFRVQCPPALPVLTRPARTAPVA